MLPHPQPLPPGPGQETVWRFPRPARVEPVTHRLIVLMSDRIVAETVQGRRAIETSHPPAYYFPPGDVDLACLRPSAGQSLCEWKGSARYFDLIAGGRSVAAAAWTYPDPTPAFDTIMGYISFYPQRVDACFVDGERVTPQDGGFYGGWITSHVVGPFKGARGTEGW